MVFNPDVESRISIHALREEGDVFAHKLFPVLPQFLSTPSARRATHGGFIAPDGRKLFLSTPSARRATGCPALRRRCWLISIHALREEGDHKMPT